MLGKLQELLVLLKFLGSEHIIWILCSYFVGTCISFTGIFVQKLMSATSFLVLINVNKFGVISLKAFVMRTKTSTSQIFGVSVAISGSVRYGQTHQAHLAQATLSSVFHVPRTLSMASIDPTPEEMQQWTDISSVLSWAGLAGDPTEAASPAGSFLRHLGFTSTAPVRVLGMISASDLTEFLKGWKIDGENATPAQRAQAALVGSGARVATGTQRTVTDSRIAAAVALAAASANASAAAPAASSGVPVLSGQDKDKDNAKSFLKLSDVEFSAHVSSRRPTIASKSMTCAWVVLFWTTKSQHMAQLSAMKHVVTHGCVPYADFGVFGPHAIRMMRKLRLTGLMLGPSGELFRSEMAGPMTYDQWEACFMVFRSAMVMLEFASPSSL